MAINFPSTAGQATDGSYTYTVAGITYSWDGSSWSAAGAGASATDRTLFSVSTSAAGTAALSYNSNSGVFSYTPPDLSSYATQSWVTGQGYLTAEVDTLQTVTARGATTNQTLRVNNSGGNQVFQIDSSTGRLTIGSTSLSIAAGITMYHGSTGSTATLTMNAQGGTIDCGQLTAGGLTYPTSNGNSGEALISNGSGGVNWGPVASTGLQSRTTALVTQSIANGAVANLSITTPKTYVLYSIETSHAAWVTLYSDTASRTADASRAETTDPTPGSGVLAEVITTGATTQLITPGSICFNSAATGITYAKVVNKSGSTANVSVTLTYLQLEA